MSTEIKFHSTTNTREQSPSTSQKITARSNLRRDDTSLSTITKEIDDALQKQDGHKQRKLLQVRSNSLYKLNQEQIEDLILQEQNTGAVSRNKLEGDNYQKPESSLSNTLAQEWELQVFDKNESWTVSEGKGDSDKKVATKEADHPKRAGHANKSIIYYDTTDVELLNSIEQAFCEEKPAEERAHSTTSSSSSSSRSSSSMSSSSANSGARNLN